MLKGFDISAYQDSEAPAADFVFVKATEGRSYTNGKFAAQWASAKQQARVRGAYHFARPEETSAIRQADRFVDLVEPQPGEVLWLDLEASGLSQAATNTWAKIFGDRLRERAPGVKTGVYLGSGYARSGTGRGLSAHYDLWWYPQYPSTARTSRWPSSFSPWLPSGLTVGWERPHIWQFSANFNGLDANVSWLTIDELAGTGGMIQEDDMAQVSSLGVEGAQTIAAGEHADIKWTKEYSDKAGLHGDGGVSVVIAKEKLWAVMDAQFMLSGLGPGEDIQVAWTRVDDSGKYLDDAWGPFTYTADADGVVHGQIGGQFGVDSTNRVRLRVYNASGKAVTVVTADADRRPVTMAKATLLKY